MSLSLVAGAAAAASTPKGYHCNLNGDTMCACPIWDSWRCFHDFLVISQRNNNPIQNGINTAHNVGHAVVYGTTSSAVHDLAVSLANGVSELVRGTAGLWVKVPSAAAGSDPVVSHAISEWMWPWTFAVAVLGLIVAAMRMAVTRKGAPMADAISGLVTMTVTIALAAVLPLLLMKAGDSFSTWILDQATGGKDFGTRIVQMLAFSTALGPAGAAGAAGIIIVLAVVFLVVSAIQSVLLILRLGAVVILTGMLPLAAAGRTMPATRGWLPKVAGWTLAIIFWKPEAACVEAGGFLLVAKGSFPLGLLEGIGMVGMSIVALPVMIRLFSWTTGELAAGGGGILGTMLGAANAMGAMRGGGMTASGMAGAVRGALGGGDDGGGGQGGQGSGGGSGAAAPGSGAGQGQGPDGGGQAGSQGGQQAGGGAGGSPDGGGAPGGSAGPSSPAGEALAGSSGGPQSIAGGAASGGGGSGIGSSAAGAGLAGATGGASAVAGAVSSGASAAGAALSGAASGGTGGGGGDSGGGGSGGPAPDGGGPGGGSSPDGAAGGPGSGGGSGS